MRVPKYPELRGLDRACNEPLKACHLHVPRLRDPMHLELGFSRADAGVQPAGRVLSEGIRRGLGAGAIVLENR